MVNILETKIKNAVSVLKIWKLDRHHLAQFLNEPCPYVLVIGVTSKKKYWSTKLYVDCRICG